MSKSIVLYRGPSMLDGTPIVAIATIGSTNEKTGPMVQTWILRADRDPLATSKAGADGSVCGQCPRRHSLGGDCYVTLFQAPLQVWRTWEKAGKPRANWFAGRNLVSLQKAAREHGFRMGSYGDPAAVPHTVWASALALLQPRVHTGYTHQWRAPLGGAQMRWLQANVMASADTAADALEARAAGFRYFLAVTPDELANIPEKTIMCLADRPKDAKTCETCGICNGTRGKAIPAVSIYLVEHGAKSKGKHKRLASLAVLK